MLLLVGSSIARAQQSGRRPKIGFLYPGPAASAKIRIEAILDGLRTAGYRELDQIEVASRSAEGDSSRLPILARELIGLDPQIVVAVSTAAARSLQAAGATMPIVAHDLETDPVASGLIESYGRPGGTVTGVFFDFPEIRAKWLELLQEVVPALSRIGVVWDPASGSAQRDALVSATDGLNISAITIPVRALSELESAFEMAGQENLDALLILSSPLFGAQANLLADLALRHKLPTVTLFPDFARAGGLMAYGPNLLETYRPLGRMIAQILRGAAPGEIAVERPSKFELVVNVRAARAIGLTVPTAILLRADEVIE